MSILTSKDGEVSIVMPGSRLDTNNAPEAQQRMNDIIEGGELKIVIDFSKTDYLSSAGLRVLLKSAKLLKQKGGTIVLCNANEQIYEVFEISGFLTLMSHFSTLDEAVKKVSS